MPIFKTFIFFLVLLCSLITHGARAPITADTDGKLARPSAYMFAEKNNLVSNEVICIRVDMFRGGWDDVRDQKAYYWWEAEIKVLAPNGTLLYHVSTVWRDRSYHENLGVEDDNCRIFYYPSGSNFDTTGICAKPKKELLRSSTGKGMSISKFEGLTSEFGSSGYFSRPISITTIEFYPNLSGKLNGVSIREIFLNPENTIVVARKNSNEIERDEAYTRIWRAPIIIYYRR